MWHEKAAAGNIFRQPQIILHVCLLALWHLAGEGVWWRGVEETPRLSGYIESSWGYYNICLFVDIKTQFMQRHYYQTMLTFETRLKLQLQLQLKLCLVVACNFVDFYTAVLVVCRLQIASTRRFDHRLYLTFDFNDSSISFNDRLFFEAATGVEIIKINYSLSRELQF